MVTNFLTFGDEAQDNDSCVPASGNPRSTPLEALRDAEDTSQGDVAEVAND